jgi:hypothetical protein
MFRKGRFALWRGKEYELISYQRQYYLHSKDRSDLQNGFTGMRSNEHAYIKAVSIKELDDAYEVIPYAMISSYRFAVEGYNEKTASFVLVTNNPFVQKKISVLTYGQFEYIIEVPKDEIKIKEDRLPIFGFENTYH